MTLDDLRIVYDPTQGTFAIPTRAWLAGWRAAHPLPVATWSDARAKAYVSTLVRLTPRLDDAGFVVTSFRASGPLRYAMGYRAGGGISARREWTLEVTLRGDGSVAESDALLPVDGPGLR